MALIAEHLINYRIRRLLNRPEVRAMGTFVESIESLTLGEKVVSKYPKNEPEQSLLIVIPTSLCQ